MTEQQNQKQQAIDLLENRYRDMENDAARADEVRQWVREMEDATLS